MTDYTKRTDEEARTLELLNGFKIDDSIYTTTQCVKMAWRAMWSLSVPVDKIVTVATALGGMQSLDSEVVQSVLTKMVRAKVLRSKVRNGHRFYEVNY